MGTQTPLGRAAQALCDSAPQDKRDRTLARQLAAEHGISTEQARGLIRYYRGVSGKKTRKYATAPVEPGAAGWKPEMPPSKAREFEPYYLGDSITVGILADTHFPYHSEQALGLAVDYLKQQKVDNVLLNGDFGDWYAASTFQKNPKHRNLKAELESQRAALAWLRAEFPTQRITLKKGNHDERWEKYLWNKLLADLPEIADEPLLSFEEWLHTAKHNIDVVGDKRPIMAGRLPILHGHEFPSGISNPVNMARGAFLRLSDSVLVAHGHRTSQHVEPTGLWHHEVATWSMGCLCDLHPDYNPVGNRWNHGFAIAHVAEDGEYDLLNYRINRHGQVRRG